MYIHLLNCAGGPGVKLANFTNKKHMYIHLLNCAGGPGACSIKNIFTGTYSM
jgi:hypothetical protein